MLNRNYGEMRKSETICLKDTEKLITSSLVMISISTNKHRFSLRHQNGPTQVEKQQLFGLTVHWKRHPEPSD